ncbi:MAG: GNAT family N-acetyltransferase [Bdellovibrionales bacterium]|nr:GNAT family N-acetyltransferase [Bdellovibrionales bacterium]
MIIQKESITNYTYAQKFYSSVGYFTEIQAKDIVFSAYKKNKIIGLVRLSPENNLLVLRGMMISQRHQRKGVGSLLLKELEKTLSYQDCFCLPHSWLESFYGQIGFQKINESTAPQFLQERLIENKIKYPHLIIMKRSGCIRDQ